MADIHAPERTPRGAIDGLRQRHPSDIVRVVLGLVLLAVASLPVRPDSVSTAEAGAFAAVNGLPDWLFWLAWPPMQLGSLVAVGVVAAAAVLARRRWLAIEAALAGSAAWVLAKVLKDAFGRPRPGGLLDAVAFRGGEPVGFGFVSGHTAVAFALAAAVALYVPRRWRTRLFGLAALVGLTRMFVGAHLPLDVVGGAALGWAVTAAVRLVLGAATGRPTAARVKNRLAALGFEIDRVTLMTAPAGTASVFSVRLVDGREQVAKVLSDRRQDRDGLYRWWLRLLRRTDMTSERFASPRLQVEHEATRMLLAASAGVRTPQVRHVGTLDAELAVLITDRLPGAPVPDLAALSPAARADLVAQVGRLHSAGIAHGHLVAGNLILDGDCVALVDFGSAVVNADDATLADDRTALETASARQHLTSRRGRLRAASRLG